MASYREIVTKSVIGKGKKTFTNNYTFSVTEVPTTILGCWVINHTFKGFKEQDKIRVEGSCDVNIWYAYDNDTKTVVVKQTISYNELLNVTRKKEANISSNEEVIVVSLKQPTCTKADIKDGKIDYSIEKELGIELVGDTKVKVAIDDDEDDWEEIIDETEQENIMEQIDKEVKEDFINDKK